jgi:hypothetical protein
VYSYSRFDLDGLIPAISEIVATLLGGELIKQFTDGGPEHLLRACARFAQERLELGEQLLNRIEIGAVGREIQ